MPTLKLGRLVPIVVCGLALVGTNCIPPGTMLVLSTSVLTVGADQDPDGYLLQLEYGNAPIGQPIRIPANGRVDLGEHATQSISGWQVRMTDIAANCGTAANPVLIPNAGHAHFEVTCVANEGALDLSVTTLGTAYKSAFELSFDWRAALIVATSGAEHTTAPVGQRTVTLGGLPAHCSTQQPARTVAVTFGATLVESWQVTCASDGVLDVILNTTGTLPPGGYDVNATFTVDNTPVVLTKPVQANGTVRFDDLPHFPLGVQVDRLAAGCTVSGSNPRTVTLPVSGVGTETFSVNCPAPQVLYPLVITLQKALGADVTVLADAGPLVCTALQCAADFLEGTQVNLTLTPQAGSVVSAITGDCVPGAGFFTASVLMSAARACNIVIGLLPVTGLRHLATRNYPWNGEVTLAKLIGQTSALRRSAGQRAASATLLVAARVPNPNNGSAPVVEYNLDNPANPVEVSDGGLCGVRSMVYALDPAIGPTLYGFSGDAPWSCLTQYPPGGLIALFNLGATAGEALTLPSDPSHILVGGLDGYLRRMPLGGNTTFHQLVTNQVTCLGDLALHGNTLLIGGREGTAGTSTANCDNHRGLWRFDLTTNTVTGFVSLGGKPRDVALSSDGTRAYVADYAGNAVHVVDVAAMTLVRSIPMSGGPVTLALTPDGTHLLVGLWDANELRMVSLANDQVVDTESSRGVHPAGLVIIDQLALLLNFGDPTPVTGTGSSLAVFEFSTGGSSSLRAAARGRR